MTRFPERLARAMTVAQVSYGPLSPTMQTALRAIVKAGSVWLASCSGAIACAGDPRNPVYIRGATIDALLKRGLIEITSRGYDSVAADRSRVTKRWIRVPSTEYRAVGVNHG